MAWYEVLSAVVLGLVGSLHCVGMCGPIVWWLPKPYRYFGLYGLGKTLTYGLMGALLGTIGFSVQWAGFQQYLSLLLGILIMFVFLGYHLQMPEVWKKAIQSRLKSTINSVNPFWMGFWSGFLPCGLVYTALTAALMLGSIASSSFFMIVFGIATLPALFLFHQFSNRIQGKWANYTQKVQKMALFFMAILLIIRGLNLGIPYLSPKQLDSGKLGGCCKTKKVSVLWKRF